jgi:hypothetical protein
MKAIVGNNLSCFYEVMMIFRCLLIVLGWIGPLIGQVPYYGPNEGPHFTQPRLSVSEKVRVQILIYDQPDLGGLKIEEVIFNGTSLSLQSADLNGFRGGGSFQVIPGTYQLVWKVSRSTKDWPRVLKHQKEIKINQRDSWMQITIQGDQSTVL